MLVPQHLIDAAVQASQNAHAPYSNYRVGCAIQTIDGTVITGCNVENASYGLSNCAERTAIFSMVASGGAREIEIVCVATRDGGSPCGACRQVLAEFGRDFIVASYSIETQTLQTWTIDQLLPDAFSLKQ